MNRVLILCNDFPPINSIGADRPYSWYKYFNEFGLYPIIITKNWKDSGTSRFRNTNAIKSVESSELGEVIRVPGYLTPSSKFAAIFGEKFPIVRRVLTFLDLLFRFDFFLFDQNRNIYLEALKYLYDNKDVNVVITTAEPFILFKYGHLLKRKRNVTWIADYRDGWFLNHVTSIDKSFVRNLIRRKELNIEKKIVNCADLVTTVDENLAQKIGTLIDKKVKTIYNGFWEYHDNTTFSSDHVKTSNIVLVHNGTITPGQRIEFLFDTLVVLKNEHHINESNIQLYLVGIEYFPDQMQRISKYKDILGNILQTTKRVSKSEAILFNLKADYLVNFTDAAYTAIYAKTYEYIAARKPILVLPGDNGLLDSLITKNNLGIVFKDKERLKEFLLSPKKIDINNNNMDFFSRKNQAKIFSEHITKCIEKIEV
jgi:hypothetical protein